MENIPPTDVFSVLSNAARLRCLCLVAGAEDVCVCEVVAALKIAQPAASKALNALKTAGLLTARRDANWTYYRLNPTMPPWIHAIVVTTVDELAAHEPYRSDLRRLRRLDLRPTACA